MALTYVQLWTLETTHFSVVKVESEIFGSLNSLCEQSQRAYLKYFTLDNQVYA